MPIGSIEYQSEPLPSEQANPNSFAMPPFRLIKGADGTDGTNGISTFPTVKPRSGRYSINSLHGTTLVTGAAMAANGMYLDPWFAPWDMTLNEVGIWCATAVASALAKIVIYGSDANGEANDVPLYEGPDLNMDTTGYKASAISPSLVLPRGTKFWLAVRSSSTAAPLAHQLYASPTIDAGSVPATTTAKIVRRAGVTFANPAPSWVYDPAEIIGNTQAYAFWMKEA